MKIAEIHSEIVGSEKFKSFKVENPSAFLCSGLFVLVPENVKESDKIQLNFYLPDEKKIASCDFPFGELKIHEEEIVEQEELDFDNLKVDILDLRELVKEKFGERVNKIIAVLNKGVWDLTCLDDGLGMNRLKLDAFSGEVVSEEKGSLNDIIRFEKGNKKK